MTVTQTKRALEACPFCGTHELGRVEDTGVIGMWRLLHRCSVIGVIIIEAVGESTVISRWNTRAPTLAAQPGTVTLPVGNGFALVHQEMGVMVDSVCAKADEVWGEIGVEFPSEIAEWEAAGWHVCRVDVAAQSAILAKLAGGG